MDVVADELTDGRRFRALTMIDLFTRECLEIMAGRHLRGNDVAAIDRRRAGEDRCVGGGTTMCIILTGLSRVSALENTPNEG